MHRKKPTTGKPRPHRLPTVVDIMDRVLDRGIVIEYHAHVSVGGIDTLLAVDARYIVTSFRTYLDYSPALRTRLLDRREAVIRGRTDIVTER